MKLEINFYENGDWANATVENFDGGTRRLDPPGMVTGRICPGCPDCHPEDGDACERCGGETYIDQSPSTFGGHPKVRCPDYTQPVADQSTPGSSEQGGDR